MCKKTIITTGLSVFIFLTLVSIASAGGIGTEAGDWEYSFDSPDVAVEGYQYDQESLTRVGTEAGDWEFKGNYESDGSISNTANEAVADEGKVKDAVCKGC